MLRPLNHVDKKASDNGVQVVVILLLATNVRHSSSYIVIG